MRAWVVVCCSAVFAGCVSAPEAKEASASIGVSMQTLHAAQLEFKNAFLAEVDETRALVGRAIVNSAVVNIVGTLAEQETNGDLIAISSAIAGEREAYRLLVNAVMAAPPQCDTCDEAVVDGVFQQRAAALRTTATALEAAGAATSAAELRQRAVELDAGSEGVDQYDDFLTLVTLARTRNDVMTGMADFEAYVGLLQEMHAEVNEWIVTDASVDGASLAAVMERLHSPTGGSGR